MTFYVIFATLSQSVSASDKEGLKHTTEDGRPSTEAPQKPPRSNTNTAPEKPKRASKLADNTEQNPSSQEQS